MNPPAPRRPGKPAKKYSQAARLHDVIRILEARYGATVDELAEECGVTRRTVYRDLGAISDAGYPLTRDPQADGTVIYSFITGFKSSPPITFSLNELMTLYLSRGQLSFLQGTPFQDDLDAVFGRIRSNLPPRSVAHLERLAEAASPRFLGIRNYRGKRDILEKLRDALLYQYRCSLRYAPPHRTAQEYLFDPYTLLFYKDSLYIAGYAHNRKALRLFLVDRLEDVAVTKDRFEVPADYRIDSLLGDAFGLIDEEPMEIKVRFAAPIAHLIRERLWHPGQTVEEEAAGSVLLSFAAGGQKELLAWLYSYLPHVQVLEPPALKEAFRQGLEEGLVAAQGPGPKAQG